VGPHWRTSAIEDPRIPCITELARSSCLRCDGRSSGAWPRDERAGPPETMGVTAANNQGLVVACGDGRDFGSLAITPNRPIKSGRIWPSTRVNPHLLLDSSGHELTRISTDFHKFPRVS
jgi:hypothetical protein